MVYCVGRFSILENVALMGIPVPKILLKLLEVMKERSDVPEKQPATSCQEEKEKEIEENHEETGSSDNEE